MTGKGHEETFWGDDNLYLDWDLGYRMDSFVKISECMQKICILHHTQVLSQKKNYQQI